MSAYNKSVLKPVFKLSKDQFVRHDKATPLRNLMGNIEKTAKSTDYTIKTDLNIGHDGDWDDVKRMMIRLHFQREEDGALPSCFKLEEIMRPNSHKSGFYQVTLPDKDEIIHGDTKNYLVLIPRDEKTVIMPLYYKFLEEELKPTNKSGTQSIYKNEYIVKFSGLAEIRNYNKRNGTIWVRIQH